MVTIHDKTRSLVGAIDIDHATVLQRPFGGLAALVLIGNHADGHAAKPAVAAHQRLAIFRLVLIKRSGIQKARQHIAHIVFLAQLGGQELVQIGDGFSRLRLSTNVTGIAG